MSPSRVATSATGRVEELVLVREERLSRRQVRLEEAVRTRSRRTRTRTKPFD